MVSTWRQDQLAPGQVRLCQLDASARACASYISIPHSNSPRGEFDYVNSMQSNLPRGKSGSGVAPLQNSERGFQGLVIAHQDQNVAELQLQVGLG